MATQRRRPGLEEAKNAKPQKKTVLNSVIKFSKTESEPLEIVENLIKLELAKIAELDATPNPGLGEKRIKDLKEEGYEFVYGGWAKGKDLIKCAITGTRFKNGGQIGNVVTKITHLKGSNNLSFQQTVEVHPLIYPLLPIMFYKGSSYKVSLDALLSVADLVVEVPLRGIYAMEEDAANYEYQDYYKFNNCKFESTGDLSLDFFYGLNSPTFSTTYQMRYSFGVEIECVTSYLAPNITKAFNAACVRDGSIGGSRTQGGPEYVTGILKGDAGMLQLQKLVNFLSPRSSIDRTCGIHVHIGGFKVNKQFALAIHKLGLLVQTDLLKMLPVSRRSNEYCRPMKDIGIQLPDLTKLGSNVLLDKEFDKLVNYIGCVDAARPVKTGSLNKRTQHPMGKKCGYNHSTPRYEWINFVPLLFDDKGIQSYTIEFRPHSASLNYEKIKNWVLICMALVKFAEENYDLIRVSKSLTIEEIINLVTNNKASSLINYINNRKALFTSNSAEGEEYSKDSFNENISQLSLKELCA